MWVRWARSSLLPGRQGDRQQPHPSRGPRCPESRGGCSIPEASPGFCWVPAGPGEAASPDPGGTGRELELPGRAETRRRDSAQVPRAPSEAAGPELVGSRHFPRGSAPRPAVRLSWARLYLGGERRGGGRHLGLPSACASPSAAPSWPCPGLPCCPAAPGPWPDSPHRPRADSGVCLQGGRGPRESSPLTRRGGQAGAPGWPPASPAPNAASLPASHREGRGGRSRRPGKSAGPAPLGARRAGPLPGAPAAAALVTAGSVPSVGLELVRPRSRHVLQPEPARPPQPPSLSTEAESTHDVALLARVHPVA